MAFVLPMVGYGIYQLIARPKDGEAVPLSRELVAAGVGSYVGINAAALCAAIEFGIQPLLFTDAAGRALYCPYPLWVSIPAMLAGHLTVFGAAEVVFTVGILAYVRKAAPGFGNDLADAKVAQPEKAPKAMAILMAVLIVLTPLGLLAEGDAWGEWGAEDLATMVGYTPQGMADGWEWSVLLPDYSLGSLPDWVGYILSAIIGAALLVIVFRILAGSAKQKVDFGTN